MTTFYASYPAIGGSGGGGGVPTYPNLASFPTASGAGNGALAIALDTDILYISNGTIWEKLADPNYSPNAITALTGDVTATGPGSVAATIAANAVTTTKIADGNVTTAKIAALNVTNALIANSTIDLTTKVTNVLPVANGGTNSSTALNNNRVMQSSGGKIVEAAAITANSALASDANGIPVASATTATQLGYLSTTTSDVQVQLNGLSGKAPVLVATTANITLSGEQTIDGVLTSSSRVLVKNQSTNTQNGIYVSNAGAWTRATDFDNWVEITGTMVPVAAGGTTNGSTVWQCTAASSGTVGATAITFSQIAGTGTITTDGQGLAISGNQLSLALNGTTLAKSVSGLNVATGGITNNEISSTAGIVRSKLANGTANVILINNGSGVFSVNASITANRAIASNASGLPVASATTDTQLGFLSTTTSDVQTQLNGKVTNPLTTLGDIIYENATPAPARLAGNITTTKNFLTQTGTGAASAAPAWGTIASADLPAATSTAQGAVVGLKQYVVGTAYTNGTPAISAFSGFTTVTSVRSVLVPYQTVDGAWRLRANFCFTSGSSTASGELTLSGVTFKNVVNYKQSFSSGGTGGPTTGGNSYTEPNTGRIQVNATSADTAWVVSGDVELDSKPTWAD